MVTKTVGKGSDYLLATRDANKEVLDAEASTIRWHCRRMRPEKFWSFMIYDNQTRSMLETDQNLRYRWLSEGIKKTVMVQITIHFLQMHQKEWKMGISSNDRR